MTPDEIKHFLVIYDPTSGKTNVQHFGTDYEAAQRPTRRPSGPMAPKPSWTSFS